MTPMRMINGRKVKSLLPPARCGRKRIAEIQGMAVGQKMEIAIPQGKTLEQMRQRQIGHADKRGWAIETRTSDKVPCTLLVARLA